MLRLIGAVCGVFGGVLGVSSRSGAKAEEPALPKCLVC